MKTFTYTVDRALNDALRSRQIELDSIKHLLAFAWSTTEYQIPQDRIDKLQKQFSEINGEYSLLKLEIEKAFGPEVDKSKASWNLDFETSEVTVTVND